MALSSLLQFNLLLSALTSASIAGVSTTGDDLTVPLLEEVRDEVLSEVEELRGGEFSRSVAVKVTSKAGFLEYVQERTNATQSEAHRRAEEQASKLLGLIPVDIDLEATMFGFLKEQVGGFYEPSEETFYIVDSFSEPGVLRMILVHELTHALDDQLFGIDDKLMPLMKVNSDAALAFHSVVEGSGTTVMNQWMMPKMMNGEISMADVMKAAGSTDFGDLAEYLWVPLLHSYSQGAAFLARTDSVMKGAAAKPPAEDIDRAFQSPPRSTEQVLHPEKYWDEEQLDEPHGVQFDLSELSSDWKVLKEDTLGELGMALFTRAPDKRQKFSPMPRFTSNIGEGWGGDRYVMLGNGDARLIYSVTSWDSLADVGEFDAAMATIGSHLTTGAKQLGGDLGGFHHLPRAKDEVVSRFMIWSGIEQETAARLTKSISVTITQD